MCVLKAVLKSAMNKSPAGTIDSTKAVTLASSRRIAILATASEGDLEVIQCGAGSPGAGRDAGATGQEQQFESNAG